MEEKGRLKGLTHVNGASAGAMAASFLAIGMSNQDINTLTSKLNIAGLLDKSMLELRAKGDWLKNVLDVIYMLQIKKHLASLKQPIPENLKPYYEALDLKIKRYEWALKSQDLSLETVDDMIGLSQSPNNLNKLNEALAVVPQALSDDKGATSPCHYFTFGDLGKLRELLPEKDKTLIKKLSIPVTNQTQERVEYYGEATTPEAPLAQAVQWSGAHPLIFRPGVNQNGDQMADGGILDNMPEMPDSVGRTLYVKSETGALYNKRRGEADRSAEVRPSSVERLVDAAVRSSLGGGPGKATAEMKNREKIFHMDNVQLFINTGKVGLSDFSVSEAERNRVDSSAHAQTLAFLENQEQSFAHPLLALLYVHPDNRQHCWDDELDAQLSFSSAAQAAEEITNIQKEIMDHSFSRNLRLCPESLLR